MTFKLTHSLSLLHDEGLSLSVLPPQKFEKSNRKKDLPPVSEFICAQFHPLSTPSFLSSFLPSFLLLQLPSLFRSFQRGSKGAIEKYQRKREKRESVSA